MHQGCVQGITQPHGLGSQKHHVIAAARRLSQRLEAGESIAIEDGGRQIGYGGIQLTGLNLAHGVGRSLVGDQIHLIAKVIEYIVMRRRGNEHSDFGPPAIDLMGEIGPIVQVPVVSPRE